MSEFDLDGEIEKLDMVPLNGKIVIKEKVVTMYGSIHIPKTSEEMRATEGVVLAIADDVENLCVGDTVFYGRYAGIEVIRGEKRESKYYLMSSEDVLCLIS